MQQSKQESKKFTQECLLRMEHIHQLVNGVCKEVISQKAMHWTSITELDQQIEKLQKRRKQLVTAKRQCDLILRLRKDGGEAWKDLTNRNKWKKEHILAVFCCPPNKSLPRSLTEEFWDERAPEELRDDRDIFIARCNLRMRQFHQQETNHGEDLLRQLPLIIPDALLGDAQVVAIATECHPQVLFQQNLKPNVLDDYSVFHGFLKSPRRFHFGSIFSRYNYYPHWKTNALERFSIRIRSNQELVLQAAIHGLNVLEHMAGQLLNDLNFAISIAKMATGIPDNVLEHFSERFRANLELVLIVVQKNGLCLQHAADSLRDDWDVVTAAADNEPLALQYCLPGGKLQRCLGADRMYMKDIFRRCPKYLPDSSAQTVIYEMLSPELKRDLEIIVEARHCNVLNSSYLSSELVNDPDFWMTLIQESSLFWHDLPDNFKDDIQFVRYIKNIERFDSELVVTIVTRFPELAADKPFWNMVIESEFDYEDLSYYLLGDLASPEILCNKQMMIKACIADSSVLNVLEDDLGLDRDIIQAVVCNSDLALFDFPLEAQLLYPDLTAKAIENFADSDDVNEISHESIAEPLWENIHVLCSWFKVGGNYHDLIPLQMSENPIVGLTIAEKDLEMFGSYVSYSLRSDKDFMLQAVQKNSMVYIFAEGGLVTDEDVTLAAFACEDAGYYCKKFAKSWMYLKHLSSVFFVESPSMLGRQVAYVC